MTDTDTTKNETIIYTADVVCFRENTVLQVQRRWAPHAGAWALPGGHVDAGETALDAAARELLEETGVAVATMELWQVGVFDEPRRDPRGRVVTVAWRVTVPADTTAHAADDAAAVRWAPIDTPDAELAFDHAEIIRTAWQQHRAAADKPAAARVGTGRCPAAHPAESSPCTGPLAVTVVDDDGAGADGCEHHAAQLLAMLPGTRPYARPDAAPGAAIRAFKAATALRRQPGHQSPAS